MIFHKTTYERIIENYSFIKNLSSFKIALPQDDYYCNDELNELLNEFGIEVHQGIAKTGVVGVLKKGTSNKSIGIRADMDALPINEITGTFSS